MRIKHSLIMRDANLKKFEIFIYKKYKTIKINI
jgi:hypothetical protein